ncbi:sulfatase-like hydrolase/transferase [Marinoscillum furvescens]|uniref:Arylsulfatase A-like enzyme n=1 Tax=Marinoscillum furvescens DSM 4134 TaxID=1122208 RepID=A0A3D9L6I4_MARFU|nr:sulfatase-like hydrolase/transferase [Marinoscillum furvescens]REE00187.1 arylsulfatase A-like enzyme [Marinoscillum furvescens DSM 4134]
MQKITTVLRSGIILWGAVLMSVFFTGCSDTSTSERPPNILFLFSDDQIYSSIHALGNEEIYTPNLDRLVRRGTSLTNAFNMGGWNGAICTASRSMLITGRSLWHANAFRQSWKKGQGVDQTWGKLMQQAGYDTYMTGKWHVELDPNLVFDTVRHVRKGMPNDYRREKGEKRLGYNRPKNPTDTSWLPTDPKHGGYWEGGKHWSEVTRDDALDYLDMAGQSDRPFMMYVAFNAPHDPRQAPQAYQDLYDTSALSLPLSYQPDYPDRELMGNPKGLRDEALAPFPRTPFAVKTHKKEYYAIISHLDAQIGKILDALEASGQLENTYIFFTSDHGLAMGRHGLIGKQSMYDHSVKPPLIIAGPDIPKNKRITAEVYLQDLMPTALELAGVPKPDYVEFHSLLPLATGAQQAGNYPAIYGAYMQVQRMVRKDGFKLIVYPKAQKVLLFDLENDPEEINDISADPAYTAKLEELWDALMALQQQYDDPLDLKDLTHFVSGAES